MKLFLMDGSPHGIVLAEIVNWSGKVLAAPRGRLSELLHRPEASRTGIYVLLGPDPDVIDGLLAYIGEADDIAARMRIHLRSEEKDFFDRLAFVVSSDDSLTKGHVRYLEGRLIRIVKQAGSVPLTNTKEPDFQKLPEADRADMDRFMAEIETVLPVLGFDLFRRRMAPAPAGTTATMTAPPADSPVFVFATAGVSAEAREADDGFVVLAGSTARLGPSGTFPMGYRSLRDRLIGAGSLVEDGALLRFTSDTVFSSPSAAASIVAARSASGPLEWKLKATGQTYRDWRAGTI